MLQLIDITNWAIPSKPQKHGMAEIAVLRTHIVNYAKTHPVYDAYRKAGYSKEFLDTHREEITLHKAAKTLLMKQD